MNLIIKKFIVYLFKVNKNFNNSDSDIVQLTLNHSIKKGEIWFNSV